MMIMMMMMMAPDLDKTVKRPEKGQDQGQGSDDNDDNEYIVMNPGESFCSLKSEDSNLKNEIGIKELDALYFDVYDDETNKWNKRSESMEKSYEKDVLDFYRIFTGKLNKPSHIKTFADIETLEFNRLTRCINRDYYQDLLISKNDELFVKYMEKIYMIQNITSSYKQKLFHILKQIFVPNDENNFTISPSLTLDKLLEYQSDVKSAINKIYLNCERLFIEALIIYERIYENQYGKLIKSKYNNVKELNNNMSNVENTP